MSTITQGRAVPADPRQAATGRIQARALGVAAAVAAALAVWAVAVPGFGADLLIRFGNGSPQKIQPWLVGGAALAASSAGWLLLVVLEHHIRDARTVWTAAAVIVAVASLSLPAIAGVTVASGTALALMHVAIAAVLIPVLRRGGS